MAQKLTQANRIAEFSTPLGQDKLVLIRFHASEGLGELFEYQIEALSEEENIDFDKVLGQGCTLKIDAYEGKQRIFNGILTHAQWVGKIEDFYRYRVVLRPWFYLLGYRADCRIFLDKDPRDIIKEVFTKAGFNDFSDRTTGDYDKLDYCVQYRETDLAFVCRLMELYGIYYFFEHSDGKHTLVMADSRSSHSSVPDLPTVSYLPLTRREMRAEQHLYDWVSERRFRTGKVQFNDYDYLQPPKNLLAPAEASENYSHSKFEVYDYPGKYTDEDKGKKLAQFRLEAEQALDHRRHINGDAASAFPGGLTTVDKHPVGAENQEFLIARANHRFSSHHYRTITTDAVGDLPGRDVGPDDTVIDKDQTYYGVYEFQPADRPFRMPPVTPKPRIYGIQTAKVVGKKGEESEEISTDQYGRIWVQFFWDREPQLTCPIRIAQSWASKQWGTLFIPRIGMEVVVEFLEGDPDRPLVTGCVYNGDNMPPTTLPDNKTRAGWKSNSSKGGGGKNILVFEDKKDSEHIGMFAQKDLLVTVLNSETREIGQNFMPPKGSPSRSTTLDNGDDNLTISMGDQSVSIPMGNQTTTAAMTISTTADIEMTLTVGLSTITLTPASISMESPMIDLTADAELSLTAPIINITGVVNLTGMLNVAGGMTVDGMVPMLLPA